MDGIRALGIGDGRDRGDPGDTRELRKLTKEQGWQLHLQRDHVPYRKDCEQCVMSLGTGRPHRRTKQKSAYVLSVDIGGPLRATSRDGHGYGYRYFLAASYSKPKFDDLEPPMEIPPDELAAVDFDFKNLDLEEPEPRELKPSEGPNEESEHALRRVKAGDHLWDDDEEAEAQQKEENDLEGNREIPIAPMEATSPTVPSTVGESSA